MKRSKIKSVGKIGRANKIARQKIAEIAQDMGIVMCEMNLEGCRGNFGIAPAHRHKRSWYKGDVDLLSDHSQWVAACQYCHQKSEGDRELTEKLFKKLR